MIPRTDLFISPAFFLDRSFVRVVGLRSFEI
jgi:hypothetical protein